ncbi:MAG: FAD-binding dehydrogenase [Bacteroidetes bacterium]|nr:MAG: FAD-binding dehydrogenase [Bacteroidota bacterium]
MAKRNYQADVLVAGGGLAGITTALELLEKGKKVILFDRDVEDKFGGLANWSFGGMFFVNSPVQQKAGIKDSVDLATKDWFSFAEFGENEHWTKSWARQYVELSDGWSFAWLKKHGIKFFPVVHWVERGLLQPGNSVPRFHLVWGTGYGLTQQLIFQLLNHPNKNNLTLLFQHRVTELIVQNGKVCGLTGIDEKKNEDFEASGVVVVASGGVNGSIEKVKANWPKKWGEAPEEILNGSHEYAIGDLHDAVEQKKGSITHLDRMWNYAAGVTHPKPHFPNHGLSLVPCKSALWLNYRGERMGPMPLVTGYDTRFLVKRICEEPVKYSWQVLNKKIAYKEFAISGSEHNPAVRDKKLLAFIKNILLGNKKLVDEMLRDCPDFIVANSLEELTDKIHAAAPEHHEFSGAALKASVSAYDQMIDKGSRYFNDEQLRRIAHARQYRGDKLRTCKFQKIVDPNAMPLIAIKLRILSRKSLGGIQTDLQSRVLDNNPDPQKRQPISGLYAVGEAAGFGGGGVHGKRALEGTFLSGCIITARLAAENIAKNE